MHFRTSGIKQGKCPIRFAVTAVTGRVGGRVEARKAFKCVLSLQAATCELGPNASISAVGRELIVL